MNLRDTDYMRVAGHTTEQEHCGLQSPPLFAASLAGQAALACPLRVHGRAVTTPAFS